MWSVLENYNDNNNNGLLTVYPPGGSSPVKNYNIKRMKNYNILQKKKQLKSTIWKVIILDCKKLLYKNVREISNSNTTLYAIYKLFTNCI